MDIQQFTLLAIGVGLGFFVHTIAGFAAALVAYPIILQVIDIQEAVGFLSIFFFALAPRKQWPIGTTSKKKHKVITPLMLQSCALKHRDTGIGSSFILHQILDIAF
jgi:hypothetical protein